MDINQLMKDVQVEWKTLGEVSEINRGRVISKVYLDDNRGEFPVYSSQTFNNGEIGRISTFDYDGEFVTWTTDGAYAGTVFYRKGKFSVTNICGLINPNREVLDVKFLVYFLQIEAKNHVKGGSGNPKLMSNVMQKIKIPIPPLEVQNKIVEILDKFTNYVTELTAELTIRKKQYEYYRDMLLSEEYLNKLSKDLNNVGEGAHCKVVWTTLGEVAIKTYSGGTPLVDNSLYYKDGDIPWLRTQEVKFVDIYDTENKITEAGLLNSSAKWIPENCVIIAISGATAGRAAINKIPLTTNQHCCCLEINSTKANYRYVFYWVASNCERIKKLGQGARGDLNSAIVRKFPIPLPSLAVQAHVVNILDQFDTLTSDLTQGLPLEIELRQKQYEYYRDRLLTFE